MNSLALAGAIVYAEPAAEPFRHAAVVIDGDTIVDAGSDVFPRSDRNESHYPYLETNRILHELDALRGSA